MKFKGDYMRSGKKNVDKDPWVELGPIVWISRLVGQVNWICFTMNNCLA